MVVTDSGGMEKTHAIDKSVFVMRVLTECSEGYPSDQPILPAVA